MIRAVEKVRKKASPAPKKTKLNVGWLDTDNSIRPGFEPFPAGTILASGGLWNQIQSDKLNQ